MKPSLIVSGPGPGWPRLRCPSRGDLGSLACRAADAGFRAEPMAEALGMACRELRRLCYTKTIERDEFGRITRIKEIDGKEVRYEYTGENRLAAVHDGSTWQYEYDPDGHLTRLLRDGETCQAIEREKIAETGETVVRETNSRGDETVFHLDREGNVVKQIEALGHTTRGKFRISHETIYRLLLEDWKLGGELYKPGGASSAASGTEPTTAAGALQASARWTNGRRVR